jgi:uncharacterized RDD family membrane protein YckC
VSERTHQLTILTPEGVSFALPLAGPITRCMAWLVDAFCLMAAAKTLQNLVGLFAVISPDLSNALGLILFFVLNMGYGIALEWLWQGQTLGKRVMGIRVMDMRGMRLSLSQVVLRNLLRVVDNLPFLYMLGGITCLVSRHAQRLGDLAANTIVIQAGKMVQPDLDMLLEKNRYNSLRDYPHLVARLRQQISPEEAGLALQTLLRRNELAPQARVTLFNDIEALFKKKVPFPQQASEGASAEQYVRNVVDVLYRTQAG